MSGKRSFILPAVTESTSATATSCQCLLLLIDPMSDAAMPPAPTLTWCSVSLGAAFPAWARKTNGAARPAAPSFRADRRVMRWVMVRSWGGEVVEDEEGPPAAAGE